MTSTPKNLLVELFVEELPPKALEKLGRAFASVLATSLRAQGLAAQDSVVTPYASPRRLAAHVTAVQAQAADKPMSQKLMPASVGLNAAGEPTPALLKKLASVGAAGPLRQRLLDQRHAGAAVHAFDVEFDGGGRSSGTHGYQRNGRGPSRSAGTLVVAMPTATVGAVPTLLDHDATVELLRAEFAALAELCGTLSAAAWDTPTCLPGWTVRDVVGHVIGAEAMLLGEPAPEVDVSHLSHMRNPIAEANELWVEGLRGTSGPDMVARLADVTGRRLAELDAMSQEEFDAPSWTPAGRDETYGRFMRIRHFDTYLHEQDVRLALGMPVRETRQDLASALDEVATGLGYIVGRRAAMPDGARVRIDLTGSASRTYRVQVDGRAAVVDRLDGDPTVGIELSAMRFLRLTGGRADGIAPDDDVVFTGDRKLGSQLVANMAFTI